MHVPEKPPSLMIPVKDIVPPLVDKPLAKEESSLTIHSSSASTATNSNPIITVVRDPNHPLGKQFILNPDGTVSKQASVNLSFGIAITHRIETIAELAALLEAVGDDPNAAIINAAFTGIEIGEEFLILSEREIEQHTGIPRNDRNRQKGVHLVSYEGMEYKAVGRFKENIQPSCWQYLDRDIDQHTPEQFKELSINAWKVKLSEIIPDLNNISCLVVGSTSARVLNKGNAIGGGNGHLWFKVTDPADVERFRTALLVRAAEAGLTWLKPRHSRIEPDKVVGQSLTTIFDPSVLTPGRLTFYGKPVVTGGLTADHLSVTIHQGSLDCINTSLVTLPDQQTVRSITRQAGVALDINQTGGGLRIAASDLTLNTELETADGLLTVRQYLQTGRTDKVRCQTPFRASTSMAAFLSVGSEGKPFVYDVGTSITHWLCDTDSAFLPVLHALGIADRVLEKATDDCGAPFETGALEAFKIIQHHEPAAYQRLRAQLKRTNAAISLMQLDRLVKAQPLTVNNSVPPETHHGYAKDILSRLTVDGHNPVGHEGKLFALTGC